MATSHEDVFESRNHNDGEESLDSAIATKDGIMIVEEGSVSEENGNDGASSIEEDRMADDDEDTAVSLTPTLNTNNNTENCNQQRLNLDILSTISNQSEIDAQDGDQNMEEEEQQQQQIDEEAATDADNEEDDDNNTIMLSQGTSCRILPPPDVTPALEKTTKSVAVNTETTISKPNTSQNTSPSSAPTPSASRQPSRNSAEFPASSSSSLFERESSSSATDDAQNITANAANGNNNVAEAPLVDDEAVSVPMDSQVVPLVAWENEEMLNEGDSEEEVCTCQNYTEDEHFSSEDELPSRDVDLSGYTASDPISEELLNDRITETPKNHRKRKINECRSASSDIHTAELGIGMRTGKRVVLENRFSPRACFTPSTSACSVVTTTPTSTGSFYGEKKTPRSVIPTKDNPPPELSEWLLQFQKWSNAERLLALDRLIEHCEPTQVRHVMKVIEPQFQRDFISLLPRELALQVLSYLGPKDLLRAAQTCRSWRYLADDNLMWKAKCKEVGILDEINADNRPLRRGRVGNMPAMASIWKAYYMRHYTIEMNWRSRPIRTPKVLKGHDDHVITCLQFCGNRIVSGSDDNTLKVWSAVTGRCLRTLVGHTGGVWSSQMSDNIIISGSTDRTLKVWDANSGACLHTLYGHTSTVRCMHLHGNKVVSGSRDATLRVWDINDGACLHVLVGHLAAVRCVQYDGKLVVSGAYDYMVKVWNPERQECLHTLSGHTNRVYSLQFDGIHIVSGSLDTSIRVWDAQTGECKHTLMGHQSLTSGMELRQNILVSGNADSTVKVWDILTGQCLQTLSGHNKHQSAVTCLQFNSKFVITSSDDGTVKLWDVKTGEFIRNLVTLDSGGSGGVVWRIRANQTKLICAVGSRNGTEETKLMVLDFDVEGACSKCS
ncbi:F-box/WD repeat-containing protein 7 [Culicoides brevitarsis]|uniref:F-box/WD repeat-containing protein 7 n=1 Tax=Culicoides brevitarsis TaxID=469753 RepID=UPI00307C5D86